ncbi:retropepsin-like aspartic protease [Sphingosinicella sp. CPCC 101087]|uniref:retropepsin-like aspartic protease n=1 Tax=Sphingosinicella sp. CPCC 101087 TaxID=2497754 RepID=UPI00197F5A50|nr:retropepsin-like aspartic protease [Sphingosinicella sp. CPCC 101087]
MRLRLAALALLAAGCDRVPSAPAIEYRPEEAGTVDHALCLLGFTGVELSEVTTGHQLVDLALNGRNATFVVDTGANVSVLHAPFAREFDISTDLATPGGAIGIGGGGEARQVRIESMAIAGVPIRQSRIVLADLSHIVSVLGPMSGGQISGIIGQDVLSEHRAVIDVPRSILYLIEADEDPAPVPPQRCRGEEAVDAGNMTDSANGSEPK